MKPHEAGHVRAGLMRAVQTHGPEVKHLEEAKRGLEFQLDQIRSHLERDGFTSVVQMR